MRSPDELVFMAYHCLLSGHLPIRKEGVSHYEELEIRLTTSGVDAPSVCEAESALLLLALLLLSPGNPSAFAPGVAPPVSLSSITKSIGILPFRQLMYR